MRTSTIRRIGVTLTMVAAALTAAAVPAQASVGTPLYDAVNGRVIGHLVPASQAVLAGCVAGTETFCVYTSTSYTGAVAVYAAPNGGWSDCINFAYPFDDSIDSAKNRSSRHETIYTSYNGSGTGLGFAAASSTGNIGASAPGFGNNTASSLCDR